MGNTEKGTLQRCQVNGDGINRGVKENMHVCQNALS